MLYTGYFAKTKYYKDNGLVPVSVAGYTPLFFTDPKWTFFAPKKALFDSWKKGDISNEEYSEYYRKNLDSTITPAILNKLKYTAGRYDIVLCCYEKSGDFCHRHTLASWLSEKTGLKVDEYPVK